MSGFILSENAHSLIKDSYAYWQRIHPLAGLPGRQHVEPLDISHLLAHIWLVDVESDPRRFRYRLVGSAIDCGMGRTLTGRWLDEVNARFFQDPLLNGAYFAVTTTGQPDYRVGTPIFAENQHCSWLERLLMPLARNGSDVDMLFCCTVFYDEEGAVMGATL